MDFKKRGLPFPVNSPCLQSTGWMNQISRNDHLPTGDSFPIHQNRFFPCVQTYQNLPRGTLGLVLLKLPEPESPGSWS